MLSQSALENMFRAYYVATGALPDLADWLCDEFGHELHRWQVWFEEGMDADDMPDYKPTMADLNYYLAKEGYKAIGGKNPRIVKL